MSNDMILTGGFIATAETQEAHDIAHGCVRIYRPEETHTEAHVWNADGPIPDGVWLPPCGNWRFILVSDPGMEEDSVGRNFCYCPFCKGLRAAHV